MKENLREKTKFSSPDLRAHDSNRALFFLPLPGKKTKADSIRRVLSKSRRNHITFWLHESIAVSVRYTTDPQNLKSEWLEKTLICPSVFC